MFKKKIATFELIKLRKRNADLLQGEEKVKELLGLEPGGLLITGQACYDYTTEPEPIGSASQCYPYRHVASIYIIHSNYMMLLRTTSFSSPYPDWNLNDSNASELQLVPVSQFT